MDRQAEDVREQEFQTAGRTAPRVTPDDVDRAIVKKYFHVVPGTTLTICVLTLRNGYHVTGESASASPENFVEEIGRKLAYEKARAKVWEMEGYLLRSVLSGDTRFLGD